MLRCIGEHWGESQDTWPRLEYLLKQNIDRLCQVSAKDKVSKNHPINSNFIFCLPDLHSTSVTGDILRLSIYFLFSQNLEVVEDHLQFSGQDGPSAIFKYAMEGNEVYFCFECSHNHSVLDPLVKLLCLHRCHELYEIRY